MVAGHALLSKCEPDASFYRTIYTLYKPGSPVITEVAGRCLPFAK